MKDDRSRRREVRLTARDLQLLSFMAEHRFVLETQAARRLGSSLQASRSRLRALARGGYIGHRRVFDGEPACCHIRQAGLDAIGSRLPPPRMNLACHEHDVGVAWLWLAAHGGGFGPLRSVISERELRSHDLRRDTGDEPHGVRLGGVGPHGRERLHYPDLVLVTPAGKRIAFELELTAKGRARREKILAGYAADPRIDAVLYLVDKPSIGRAIGSSARRIGASDRIHVRSFRGGESRPAPGRGSSAARTAAATAGVTR